MLFQKNWQAINCNLASKFNLTKEQSLNDCIQKCNSLDWCTQLSLQLKGVNDEITGKCFLQSSLDDISDPPLIFRRTEGPQSICMTFNLHATKPKIY